MESEEANVNETRVEILIVEDSLIQAEELRYMLETQGYHVSVAYNGVEALAAMRKHRPALVISDIVMPIIDGYELCRQIQNDEELKDIPIILLTFLSDPADVIKSLEYGAHIFVTKPYSEHSLLARIQDAMTDKGLSRVNDAIGGVEIFFAGQKHVVTSDRKQILALLLATFDNAVQKSRELDQANKELVKTQLKLQTFNEELERRVEERTIELVETNTALRQEIDRRKQAEEQIKAALEEKGVLLREVQHRVRNNLQSLIYLIDMQVEEVEAPEALLALQGRARTMALVHEKLLLTADAAIVAVFPPPHACARCVVALQNRPARRPLERFPMARLTIDRLGLSERVGGQCRQKCQSTQQQNCPSAHDISPAIGLF